MMPRQNAAQVGDVEVVVSTGLIATHVSAGSPDESFSYWSKQGTPWERR